MPPHAHPEAGPHPAGRSIDDEGHAPLTDDAATVPRAAGTSAVARGAPAGRPPAGPEAEPSAPGHQGGIAPRPAVGADTHTDPRTGGEGAEPPWSELVTAALLGSERRTPPGGSVSALLDAATVQTVRRRAGLRPAPARARMGPAPDDTRPVLPAAAARRLDALLGRRPGSAGGGLLDARLDGAALLPQWLALANAHGYRPPQVQVPALLDAAQARTELRSETLAFAGPRALWLARRNPEWRFALRHGIRHGAADRPAVGSAEQGDAVEPDGTDAQRLWDEGLFAERVALLTAVRREDPARGRALLESSWTAERAEDRLLFLDALREGLCTDDESFLERALRDRSRTVRATAAELLGTLPGSGYAARMAERARGHVALGQNADGAPCVVVDAPHRCDAGMQRDGMLRKPPQGEGERSWWLGQLVESAALDVWTEAFGGRTPAQIAALPVADGWLPDLHTAWHRAAVRQRHVAWARTLLGPPSVPHAERAGDPAALLAVLPASERAQWVAHFVDAHGASEAFGVLGVCAVPWTGPLGRSVIDALQIERDRGSFPWSLSGVMGMAERCLDPCDADRWEPLAAIPEEEPPGAAPGASAYWAETFQRLVATLRLRARMRDELADGRPADGTAAPPAASARGR